MKILSKTIIAAGALLLLGTAAFAKKKEVTQIHTGLGTKVSNPIPDRETPGHWVTLNELMERQGRKFGVLHYWGATWASVTRIQKQTGRSNFVWNDQMAGAFYEWNTNNFLIMGHYINVNLFARHAAYYPYAYTYNQIKQVTTQTILYAFDFFTGVKFSLNIHDWVSLSVKPGAHGFYQLHDKWHYFHVGAGLGIEAEFPISTRWSFNIGGMWTWDNANLGTNRKMRPFDYTWEYQAQLGFRYSGKKLNPKSFIKYRPHPPKKKHVRKLKPRKNKAAKAQDAAAAAAAGAEAVEQTEQAAGKAKKGKKAKAPKAPKPPKEKKAKKVKGKAQAAEAAAVEAATEAVPAAPAAPAPAQPEKTVKGAIAR